MKAPGERGSALLAALTVLSALTLLSTMALMAGGADLVLATRLSRERAAFFAAESALATAIAELSGGGAIARETFFEPWPAPGLPPRSWRDGPWSCSRSVALLPDTGDADGDPTTTVVLFNRRFGYSDSPLARGGYPVVQVLVAAASGESRQGIVAEVAPLTCAPEIGAAWVAAGPLEIAGDIVVSGSAPAVLARSGVRLEGGAAATGGVAVDQELALPDDALRILAAGGTLQRLEDLPPPATDGPVSGIVWARGDYAGAPEGEGILIVHNPEFDPVKHEASRRALADGIFLEGYDPAYSHLDPGRQPARLDLLRAGSFRGLVVADTVGTGAASFTLTGALVTLSRSPQAVGVHAPLRIRYSEPAIAQAGRGPLRHLTAFRPLAAPAGAR